MVRPLARRPAKTLPVLVLRIPQASFPTKRLSFASAMLVAVGLCRRACLVLGKSKDKRELELYHRRMTRGGCRKSRR